MKLKPTKLAPVLIAAGVIILICLLRLLQLDFFERLEQITYDMRVREALKFSPAAVTNLGFVDINDASIAFVKTNRSLGYNSGLYWPRHVYGRLVEELSAQGAKAVALDVMFGELRPDHGLVLMANGDRIHSDDFFALQLHRAGNTILAADQDLKIPQLFATNASALGDITTDKDSDGILRRARAFRYYTNWHWAFRQAGADPDLGIDLARASVEGTNIVLPRSNGEAFRVPLDTNGNFDLAGFGGDKLPAGVPRKARPYSVDRIWHMGIVLASRELGLDLNTAEVNLDVGTIRLKSRSGAERTIPVDRQGYFYIDWCLTPSDSRLLVEPIQGLLQQDRERLDGTNVFPLPSPWADKLVVVGSSAVGNDLTDRGATPLQSDTLLASEHWNVANSILANRFVRRTSPETDLLIVVALGILSALLTWRLRALLAFLLVALVAVGYSALGNYLYVEHRWWLPLVLPVVFALILTHVCLVTWRVVFEQSEKRHVKSIFSRIVSPNIVNELLQAEKLSLGGARREVTVLFADVRGFTEFTDVSQERAELFASEHKLSGGAMETYFNEQARQTLSTVNSYLALVADQVKKHQGTLDKYIGDCVMAFWGAPTPNPGHALACVRAAIEAQRSVYELNRKRSEENLSRDSENAGRLASGQPPLPMLPVLLLGTGINTGPATVGLMGSEDHISNYTVFGREVNLASRLESLSGKGRILISENTYKQLQRDDPALAATCVAQPDANVKGIRSAVRVYEVPWQLPESPDRPQSHPAAGDTPSSDTTSFARQEKPWNPSLK